MKKILVGFAVFSLSFFVGTNYFYLVSSLESDQTASAVAGLSSQQLSLFQTQLANVVSANTTVLWKIGVGIVFGIGIIYLLRRTSKKA